MRGKVVGVQNVEASGETMDRDSLRERGRSLEEGYFRAQDAKLLEKLREDAQLEEIVLALAEQLQVENPELLRRVIALGVRLDTGPALLSSSHRWCRSPGPKDKSPSESARRSCGWRRIVVSNPARQPIRSFSGGLRNDRRMSFSIPRWRS
jgi:hypothetical protein